MICFIWDGQFQSRHHQKELAFDKALKYLAKYGAENTLKIDFLDLADRGDKGATLLREFQIFLETHPIPPATKSRKREK